MVVLASVRNCARLCDCQCPEQASQPGTSLVVVVTHPTNDCNPSSCTNMHKGDPFPLMTFNQCGTRNAHVADGQTMVYFRWLDDDDSGAMSLPHPTSNALSLCCPFDLLCALAWHGLGSVLESCMSPRVGVCKTRKSKTI